MAVPIWKDHFSNLGAVASIYFRIQFGGTTVYSGKAVRAASSGNLYVRINDICADFMALKPLPLPTDMRLISYPMSFTVQKSTDGNTWTSVETVQFDDDWSYDTSFNPATQGMSFPITGRVDVRQELIQTRYTLSNTAVTLRYGGTIRSLTFTPSWPNSYSAMDDLLRATGASPVIISLPNYAVYNGKALQTIQIGLTTYTVTDKCPQYCLYYKNPFGGIDHLLIEGNAKRRRSVSRETMAADYNNNYQYRGEWNWQNEITESWELHTGLLTDEESSRMPYLLESPQVFFVDLSDPYTFIPCVISTDSYDVKTFKSNGRQMTDYGFEVRFSNNEYKR